MLLSRYPDRRQVLAACGLAGVALFGSSCTGTVSSPNGPSACADCFDPSNDDITGGDGDGTTPSDRPAGIGDPNSPNGVGWSTRFPKLSNEQWENTITALFYLDAPTGFSSEFTQERLDDGYATRAAAELTVSGDAWTRYQTAAEKVAELVTSDDQKLAKLLPAGAPTEPSARGASLIATFGRRAYRRPLTDAEKSAYATLFAQGPALVGGDVFKAGARLVIEAMLQSPHFLYRVERSQSASADDRQAWLSSYEMATRLSYALWNSLPSDELFAAAERDELATEAGVAKWAKSMLDDPRARGVLLSFHEQTFKVAAFGTQDKDPALGFDAAALAPVLKDEARSFFQDVVIEGEGGIVELLTSPVAFVNAATAPLYGISGVEGDALQKRSLDPTKRAGFLTQLGFLTKNATRTTSDPVHRGLVVLREILCDEPDPPPMMFELPKPEAGLTTREVYEKATACGVGCHDTLINPPGFAFEHFDAIGRVREREGSQPIDASGVLTLREGYTAEEKRENPTTELRFDGAVDMLKKLAKQERVHECYARNWMGYMLAREVDPVERGAGEALRDRSLDRGAARDLLLSLVKLDTFRSRVSE